ncbi:MAG: hypothetical protein QW400_02715 [Candidatus Diapherotrites archaeon]
MKDFWKKGGHEKAQESAPFEVLIAVIIMGFVLYIGFMVMSDMLKQDCNNRIRASIEKFRSELENVSELRSRSKIYFNPPTCYRNQKIKVVSANDEVICASACDIATPSCLFILVDSRDYVERFCLRTAVQVYFPTTLDNCPDRSSEGYTLVDLRDGIPIGHYDLVNETPPRQTFPIVCAYYKK